MAVFYSGIWLSFVPSFGQPLRFLLANGFNGFAIDVMREKFLADESLDGAMHEEVMDLFRKYLLIGGLPDAVNSFIAETNIVKVRAIHRDISAFYADDASKYEADNNKKLKIRRINAISTPVFPLAQSVGKNLLKLYLNDVGF